MRSFNDWYFDLFESGNGSCLNQQEIAQEAWDYQQSKVDELQKQVDAAQELFDNWDFGDMNLFDLLHALQKTLKGGDQNTEKQPKNIATKGVKGGDQ